MGPIETNAQSCHWRILGRRIWGSDIQGSKRLAQWENMLILRCGCAMWELQITTILKVTK